MRKFLLFVFAALLTAGYASVIGGKLSPYTRIYLERHKVVAQQRVKSSAQGVAAVDNDSISTFLKLGDGCDEAEIEANGVRVVNRFGTLLTVRIAVHDIEKVATLRSVKKIDMGAPVHANNDSARICSNVDILHQGGGSLGQQYTGKGVIVGVVDDGIEYNHINFKDADGKSRVKMVYDAIHDKTYLDPGDIAALGTDDSTDTHGTHTSGTAAGNYTKNGYQGMAPEADLVLCGAGKGGYFNNADIANSVKKILDYADLVGKPAVVNMSLGGNDGPHDASYDLCKVWDAMKSPGHIISISAGNEGGAKMYIRHKSENADDSLQFQTVLYPLGSYSGYIDLWSKSPRVFKVRIGVLDTQEKKFVAMSPLISFSELEKDSSYFYQDTLLLKPYFGGKFSIAGKQDTERNRYNVGVEMEVTGNPYGYRYGPIMLVYTKKGETIEAWSNSGEYYMSSFGMPGYTEGNDSCSINSFAYATNVIVVGGYVTKTQYYNPVYKKNIYVKDFYGPVESGDMARFSSYAKGDDGSVLPNVVAPCLLVSSLSSYERNTHTQSLCDSLNADDGRTYYWGAMAGTSMSCPVVTGIIATWLQYKPKLSVEEIKDIIKHTAIDDAYVKKYNHVKSGMGKIDAYEGLKYMLTSNIGNVECAQHQVLIYPSADGRINIYAQGETGEVRVDIYAANGISVYSRKIATDCGSATLSLGGNLAKGVYIVKVEGEKAKGSNKLIIR